MPSASLERGVRGQRRSDLLMGREERERKHFKVLVYERRVCARPYEDDLQGHRNHSFSCPSHGSCLFDC